MTELRGRAYTVAGTAARIEDVFALLRREGIEPEGNPDVYARAYAAFGIDDAREVIARAVSRALTLPHRVFIIAAPALTAEAQNALLKTLEDAPGESAFFLIVPSPDALLPTVRSRATALSLGGPEEARGAIDVREFLAAAPAARIETLKTILDADLRDLAGAYALLAGIERALAGRAGEREMREGLAAVYRAQKYIGDKGSLMKPLLEQVALLVPVV